MPDRSAHAPVSEKSTAALKDLIKSWDGKDRFYLEAIGVAAGQQGPELFASLGLNDASQFNARTIQLLQILHPKDGIELLVGHLSDPHLDAELANRVVDALGWMIEPSAMNAVAGAIARKNLPTSARKLAMQRIQSRLHGDYKSLAESNTLRDALAMHSLRENSASMRWAWLAPRNSAHWIRS